MVRVLVQWLKVVDYNIVVCEFKFQSHYYIHILTNTLGGKY